MRFITPACKLSSHFDLSEKTGVCEQAATVGYRKRQQTELSELAELGRISVLPLQTACEIDPKSLFGCLAINEQAPMGTGVEYILDLRDYVA
jgi:hypothetical protein